MTKSMKENIGAVIATTIVLIAIWLGLDAFLGLVGAVYAFLNGYIWAFFAGIIAFFFALTIVILMIKISLILLFLTLGLIAVIVDVFSGRRR